MPNPATKLSKDDHKRLREFVKVLSELSKNFVEFDKRYPDVLPLLKDLAVLPNKQNSSLLEISEFHLISKSLHLISTRFARDLMMKLNNKDAEVVQVPCIK